MKTLVLSVVFAVTSIVNAVNNNSLEGFAYNTRMDGDRVETKNVYKVKEDKYLQNHLQYNYAYDAEGRVSSKEVSKWSKGNQRFEKQYCLNFSYDGGEVNVEYAAWNRKDNAYTDVKTKAVYQINGRTLYTTGRNHSVCREISDGLLQFRGKRMVNSL